jgi:hypothetical protein
MMSGEPLTTAAVAKEAYDLYKVAREEGWLDRVVDLFKRKQRVLVLGNTGVGKTSFLNSLVHELAGAIDRFDRTEFNEPKRIRLGDHPFRFVDTPGQDEHISRRQEAYRDAVKDGVDGVINVVSYGYHEFKRNIMEAGTHAVLHSNHAVNPHFLAEQRNREEQRISEWRDLVLPGARWVITAVNKADLWWSNRSEVDRHYTSGSYFKSLGPFGQTLSPIVLQYCVRFQKFYGESPIDGTFDEDDRTRLRDQFMRQLIASVDRTTQ